MRTVGAWLFPSSHHPWSAQGLMGSDEIRSKITKGWRMAAIGDELWKFSVLMKIYTLWDADNLQVLSDSWIRILIAFKYVAVSPLPAIQRRFLARWLVGSLSTSPVNMKWHKMIYSTMICKQCTGSRTHTHRQTHTHTHTLKVTSIFFAARPWCLLGSLLPLLLLYP